MKIRFLILQMITTKKLKLALIAILAILIVIALSPTSAQVSEKKNVMTNDLLDQMRLAIEFFSGITLFGGLITAFFAMRNNAMGQKDFFNYAPSLFIFLSNLLVTLIWGFTIDSFNLVFTALALWNAMSFAYFLMEALLNSEFD